MIKIVEQFAEILPHQPTNFVAIQSVSSAARTCYQSQAGTIPDEEDLIRRCIKKGHLSILEHVNVSVNLFTSRDVGYELIRHRIAAYSQESQRYCKYGEDGKPFVYIRPWWCGDEILGEWNIDNDPPMDVTHKNFVVALIVASEAYQSLRKEGLSPQKARAVLPNATATRLRMTCNLREWRHVFTLRCGKGAYPQMQELMIPLYKQFLLRYPVFFEDLEIF